MPEGNIARKPLEKVTAGGNGFLSCLERVKAYEAYFPWNRGGYQIPAVVEIRNCAHLLRDPVAKNNRFGGTHTCDSRNCFLRNNDDNVVIKSWRGEIAYGSRSPQGPVVENILVEGCTIWNMAWGNGLEIGFELRCPAVRQVTFRDIDIIHVEHSAAISIHNGDWATVEEVTYEDIRVEDARHKLFDFAIFLSQYSADRHPGPGERERRYLHGAWDGVQDVLFYGKKEHAAYRGHIRNIQVRNVRVVDGPIPFSILCGYDRDHTVEDVIFENLRFYDQKVTGAAEGRFTVEQARGVVFR